MTKCPVCNTENAIDADICCECGLPMDDTDPMALPEGTELDGGRFVVTRFIDRGGFAMTYEARCAAFEDPVVIKELFPRDNAIFFRIPGETAVTAGGQRQTAEKLRQRFRQEAMQLFRLGHANLVRVIWRFAENGTEYLVMNRISGQTLERWVREQGAFSADRAWSLMQGLLDAVEYLHDRGVVHRDIKPGNVMIREEDRQPVLIDFGLVREMDRLTRLTGSEALISDGYSPIEQYDQGEPHPRQDLYSLGALGYFLVTGEDPPGAWQRLDNRRQLAWPADLPDTYRERMEQALQLKAEDRPEHIGAWRGELASTSLQVDVDLSADASRRRPAGGDWPSDGLERYGIHSDDWRVIPAGRFLMGSSAWEEDRGDDELQHWVSVDEFLLLATPVTWGMYILFCQATAREQPEIPGYRIDQNHPVVNVSWLDATAYCNWLAEETGLPVRLPTEAEWEYACRAGTTTPYWTGETIDTDQANFKGKFGGTTPVRQFQSNPWELHDMHGNVWEWCASRYENEYAGQERLSAPESEDGMRVLRGGAWGSGPWWLRSAARSRGYTPGARNDHIGFRLARTR